MNFLLIFFFIYLLCFVFSQQTRFKKYSVSIALCLTALYLFLQSPLFQNSFKEYCGYFVMFFLGLIFAFSLKFLSFKISILFCLFVVGARIMGFPPNRDFGEKDLGIVAISGLMILNTLWGYYLVCHSKMYQKCLLVVLSLLVSYLIIWGGFGLTSSNLFLTTNLVSPIITNSLIGCLALWGLHLSRKDCTKQSFFLLSFFVFSSILYIYLFLIKLSLIFVLLGFLIHFPFEIIYQIGEYLLLFIFVLELSLQNKKVISRDV